MLICYAVYQRPPFTLEVSRDLCFLICQHIFLDVFTLTKSQLLDVVELDLSIGEVEAS